jgi:hypothetical protein
MKEWTLKISSYYILTIHLESKFGWFRLFGKGLVYTRGKQLTFSQRCGYTRYLKIGNFIINQL